jgi:RNA polymerase sigma factor (sigma-70 family)
MGTHGMESLSELVRLAQAGDIEAYGRLVQSTQAMAYAAARAVVRDPALAEDVAQEAYLRAFRHLADLRDPSAFVGWLRRIVVTGALNVRRTRRSTLLNLDDYPDVPMLDEEESSWSEQQRQRLAGALLTLTRDERRLCDRRYHGGWSTARLAQAAGVDEAAMRKRLQRIRDRLRKEIEVAEQRGIRPEEIRADFPAKVVELLARPELTGFPENPVGKTLERLRTVFSDCTDVELPEVLDFAEARRTIGDDALYVDALELHRIDDRRILRYDLTLPLLLTVRYEGRPLRLMAAGKAYRLGRIDATHLEAFHQAEIFSLDERDRLDPWRVTAQVLQSVDAVLPGRSVKIVPTRYSMCTQAWELEVEHEGRWAEVLAWGVFTDRIVRHLGGDPGVHAAIGIGYGLERLAMLQFGIDDIRKVEGARVA